MPSYVRAGSLPHKRHIQFRRPDGGLYAEELFSTKGFESVYSLLYHLRPPTATLDVKPWERRPIRLDPNEPLRNRHFKTHVLPLEETDAIESRTPLLGNSDILISVARAGRPMEYFYRNTGGDELLFIHHGAGFLETQFGELAYRERDYLVIPTGTTYRFVPASDTRMLVHESSGNVKIPRKYRNEYGQLEEHAPYYERDFPRAGAQGARRSAGRIRNPRDQRSAATQSMSCRIILATLSAGTATAIRTPSTSTSSRRYRKAASAAAGPCDLRSAGCGLLCLCAAPLRLSSAGHTRTIQSLQRRLRRSLILRERQLHEPPRRRGRFDHAARCRRTARSPTGCGRVELREEIDRRDRRDGRYVQAAAAGAGGL